MKKTSLLLFAAVVVMFAAAPTYKLVTKIKVGGATRWDYIFVDSANHRLYAGHMDKVEVVDTATGKPVGAVTGTTGVHGVAIAPDLGRGYASDGGDNDVTVFDLKTLATISKVKTGQNPDAIIYEPVTHKVFTMNGRSKDATAFDAKTGNVIAASIAVGGKPEFAQVDGKGHIFVNIEDTAEIIQIDAKDNLVAKRWSIAPCDSPSGLVIDPKGRLYSVCENKLMIISDSTAGKVIGTAPIGQGADGVAFDDGYAFSANGGDGTITMVGETSPGKFEVVGTIPTQRSARTIASDPKAHKLYLPTAELGGANEPKDKKGRPALAADSFEIAVVGR